MKSWALPGKGRQKGAALLIFAVFLVSAVLAVFLKHLNRQGSGFADEARDGEVLLQAKEALIGFAATYRDTHPDQVFAYLPCPDTDNDGVAEAHCGLADVPALGLLPWKTLGLPPLMDNTGECLWYAVSGRAKKQPNDRNAQLGYAGSIHRPGQQWPGACRRNGARASSGRCFCPTHPLERAVAFSQ